MVATVVVTTAAKRAPVRTAELATLPPAQASQGPDKPTATTRGLHLPPRGHRGAEGRCSRCGRRHILYKQQQEQVQQTMTVTTAITKRVTPMAITVPNLTESQSALQGSRLHSPTAGSMGSIPSQPGRGGQPRVGRPESQSQSGRGRLGFLEKAKAGRDPVLPGGAMMSASGQMMLGIGSERRGQALVHGAAVFID